MVMGGLYVNRPATRSSVVGSGSCSRQQSCLPSQMGFGGAFSSAPSQTVVSPAGAQAVGSVGFLSSLLVSAGTGQQQQRTGNFDSSIYSQGDLVEAEQKVAGQQQDYQVASAPVGVHYSQQRSALPPQYYLQQTRSAATYADFPTKLTASCAPPTVAPVVDIISDGFQTLALNANFQSQHYSQKPQPVTLPHLSSGNKVFVGGLSWETSDAKLRQYFENYGEVLEAFVSYDKNTGRPRGFGFVVFASPSVADKVVSLQHTIDRREVEAKKAVPRQDMSRVNGGSAACDATKVKKIFVGGLAPTVDEVALREYFQRYGEVEDAVVMYDPHSSRPRGFGFITFCNVASVDHVFLFGVMQELHDKQIEIKRAVPREEMAPPRRTRATPPPPAVQAPGSARLNGFHSAPMPDFTSPAFISGVLQGSLAGQQQHTQSIWGNAPPPPMQQSHHLFEMQHQGLNNGSRFPVQSQSNPFSTLTAGLAAAGASSGRPSAPMVPTHVSLPLGLNVNGSDDLNSDSLSRSSVTGSGSAGSGGLNHGSFPLQSYPDRGFLSQDYSGGSSLPDGLLDSSYMARSASDFGSLGFAGMGSVGGTAI